MNLKLNKEKRKFIAKAEKVMGHYDIATPEETLDELINTNKSIARLGDGEFDMIYKIGMNYQKYDEKLAQRLKEVVQSEDDGIFYLLGNKIENSISDDETIDIESELDMSALESFDIEDSTDLSSFDFTL